MLYLGIFQLFQKWRYTINLTQRVFTIVFNFFYIDFMKLIIMSKYHGINIL